MSKILTSRKPLMIPSSESFNTSNLKMVKGANIFQERGIYFIRHYETIIFAYNPQSKLAEINMNCSRTSNKQIRNALIFFDVSEDNQIDVSDGKTKWRYSGDLKN